MIDTIVAQSTPIGESALAVIRTSGSASEKIAKALLGPDKELITRHSYYSNYLSAEGQLLDEVVWIYYEAGASYTGEAMLEIMPHGNPLICEQIIQDLQARGCRLAEPGEFTRRAYLNNRLNISQAEAVIDVIHARSEGALQVAQKHLSGESGRLIEDWVQKLTILRAEVEAYIDFPEEDLPPEDQEGPLQKLSEIRALLSQYKSSAENSRLLQQGINTLIIGAPNAGKSSLFNTLVGHSRALVDPKAGTTRDYIREQIWINKQLVNLVDTAGLNPLPGETLESQGITKALELAEIADYFLLVVDAADALPDIPEAIKDKLKAENTLIIENKIDLENANKLDAFYTEFPHIRISATENIGIKELIDIWGSQINALLKIRNEGEIMFNHRQASFIGECLEELSKAHDLLQHDQQTEFAAFHLIKAAESLSNINKSIDNEEMLDQLFSRFCIGK